MQTGNLNLHLRRSGSWSRTGNCPERWPSLRRDEERPEREGQRENGVREADQTEEARQAAFIEGNWKPGSHEENYVYRLAGFTAS